MHLSSICDAAKRDWRAAAWMLERRYPEDFARQQQFEHSVSDGKPWMPAPDLQHEVLIRMQKQRGIVEVFKKLGGIIQEKRIQREEAANAEREAATLQTPLALNTKVAKPKRAPLRE
ncbi:hypothetical protein [Verrucomicrobium spinosum]|uniref:hypothetical protein n=1 Tax=Verrucomicrobium spinosum TaxID=2736 RepID=UPI0012E1FFBE|nr:hypothetical protein [Verrucomicrobium spinosum]